MVNPLALLSVGCATLIDPSVGVSAGMVDGKIGPGPDTAGNVEVAESVASGDSVSDSSKTTHNSATAAKTSELFQSVHSFGPPSSAGSAH